LEASAGQLLADFRQEIEDRIMAARRPQGPPPTPGNPRFVGYSVDVGNDFALGVIFKTAEIAEETAQRLKLKTYSIHEEWYE